MVLNNKTINITTVSLILLFLAVGALGFYLKYTYGG